MSRHILRPLDGRPEARPCRSLYWSRVEMRRLSPQPIKARGTNKESDSVARLPVGLRIILARQQYQQILSSYFDAVVAYQNAWADLEKAIGVSLNL